MRKFGLDIFRSIAILLVVIGHLTEIFRHYVDADTIKSILGYWGVEFFFVLSGFLIGTIVIKGLSQHDDKRWISRFVYRRWLKTFPLYYLCLFFYAFVFGFPQDFILYVLYLKGLTKWTGMEFFNASWSLFVEELFYLICAAFVLILYLIKGNSNKRYLLNFCFSMMLVAIFYRFCYDAFIGTDANNPKKLAIARLDSPMMGFLLATIQAKFPMCFDKLEVHRKKVAVTAVLGMAMITYYPVAYANTAFIVGWFSAGALLSAGLLSYFFTIPDVKSGSKIRNIVMFISQSSYSVYLIHEEIIHYFFSFIKNTEKESEISVCIVILFFSIMVIYAVSYCLMKFIEIPILRWRDKYVKI